MEAVVRLDGPARYRYFVKRVADSEEAWGLWKDGWASMSDEEGRAVFPLWPADVYAAACAVDEWGGYLPERIPLRDLMEEVLPMLTANGARPGVFPTASGKGVIPGVGELTHALREELENYE